MQNVLKTIEACDFNLQQVYCNSVANNQMIGVRLNEIDAVTNLQSCSMLISATVGTDYNSENIEIITINVLTEDRIDIVISGNFHKPYFYYNPETNLPDPNSPIENKYWKENKQIIDNFISSLKEVFKPYGIREMSEQEALGN